MEFTIVKFHHRNNKIVIMRDNKPIGFIVEVGKTWWAYNSTLEKLSPENGDELLSSAIDRIKKGECNG